MVEVGLLMPFPYPSVLLPTKASPPSQGRLALVALATSLPQPTPMEGDAAAGH
jgi:hypothetical protein